MTLLQRMTSVLILAALATTSLGAADNPRPWTSSDLVAPAQLNTQLAAVKAGKIVLIQVGFLQMYKLGHIPGSQYVGAASNPEGLAAIEKLVAKLPRTQAIVIYCGCCPWDDCPNIRPAFRALKDMGFSNLKVLDIPERLGTDWSAKGLPTAKGK
jgi:thiosulfate/3-mercaptopyruvate sulfurtransferase